MKYWLLEQGDVIGPFEAEEIKNRQNFKQTTLVCPESHGDDHTQWREAYYFEDFQPQTQDNSISAFEDLVKSRPAAPPKPNFPSPSTPDEYKNISIDEYFATVYENENSTLSDILGIPEDLENSDMYLGRFLQEQLNGTKRTKNTKIKDLESGKTIDKSKAKDFGNDGKVLVSRTIKSDNMKPAQSAPAAPAKKENFTEDVFSAEPTIPPAEKTAPVVIPSSSKKEENKDRPEDSKIIVPAASKTKPPKKEENAAEIKEELEAQKVFGPIEPAPQAQSAPAAQQTPALKQEPAQEQKPQPAPQPAQEPAPEAEAEPEPDISALFDKAVEEAAAAQVPEPIKTIEPVNRLEDFLEDDPVEITDLYFPVERRRVKTDKNFKTQSEKIKQSNKKIYILAVAVIALGAAILVFANMPRGAQVGAQSAPAPAPQPAAQAQTAAPAQAGQQPAPAQQQAPQPVLNAALNEKAAGQQAIKIVQDYNLASKKTGVKNYLERYLDSYIQKGYEASWSAEHLHKDVYIVQYSLIKTRQEPIIYIFEVDVKKNIITGALNNLTLDLLGM